MAPSEIRSVACDHRSDEDRDFMVSRRLPAHDNLRVEYRPALQNHKPEDVQATIDLLEKLSER